MSARTTIVGNLTRDPVISQSAKGDAICRFGVAVSRPTRDQQPGTPSFYDVTCFGTLATNSHDSLKRGYRVIVEGNMDIRVVPRDDGSEKTFVNVVADAVGIEMRFDRAEILAGGTRSAVEQPRPRSTSERTPPPDRAPQRQYEFDEEPF